MAGKCILLGFRSGGSSGGSFEDWAKLNLLSGDATVPSKPAGTSYSDWVKQYFLTSTEGEIADPTSQTKTALIEWANENFIKLTTE